MTGEHQHGGSDCIEPLDNHRASDLRAVREARRDDPAMPSESARRVGSQQGPHFNTRTALLSLLFTAPVAMGQGCISLSGSTLCPAFSSASISTNSELFGFLYVLCRAMGYV